MVDWEDILQRYFMRYSDRIHRVTQPLKNLLGIPFFGYHRIDQEGKYIVLTDRPDWAEFYVEQKFYLNDPYLRHPNAYSAGACFFSHFASKGKEQMIQAWSQKLQADEGIVLIEKNLGSVEFFIFAGHHHNRDFSKLYLNHHSVLRHFSSHFKQELQSVLLAQEQEGYTLSFSEKEEDSNGSLFDPQLEASKKKLLFALMGHEKEWKQAQLLTPREKQCLKHLFEGQSIKGIASALSLSPRTIEYYLENIKNKMNCWSKDELIVKVKQFDQMELL